VKRILEYESGGVMPKELLDMIDSFRACLLDICREGDKLECYLGNMRHEMIVWFSNNSKEVNHG
jgi:hypothetical protein